MPLKFRPKLDKIVELLLYLAHRYPGVDKYQAVKFFYLADRQHLARYGRPITFDNYFALWYGPVPSAALDLLDGDKRVLKSANVDVLPFKVTTGRTENGNDTLFISDPQRPVNFDLFSSSDIGVFDEVLAEYRDASFNDLMELTHKHDAYRKAWTTRKQGNRAEMYYEEMIDDPKRRAALVEDLDPVSANM